MLKQIIIDPNHIAFPANTDVEDVASGLTKREYFAIRMMAALKTAVPSYHSNYESWQPHDFASEAVKMADALITELNQ